MLNASAAAREGGTGRPSGDPARALAGFKCSPEGDTVHTVMGLHVFVMIIPRQLSGLCLYFCFYLDKYFFF